MDQPRSIRRRSNHWDNVDSDDHTANDFLSSTLAQLRGNRVNANRITNDSSVSNFLRTDT
jgi:hypothetical protein